MSCETSDCLNLKTARTLHFHCLIPAHFSMSPAHYCQVQDTEVVTPLKSKPGLNTQEWGQAKGRLWGAGGCHGFTFRLLLYPRPEASKSPADDSWVGGISETRWSPHDSPGEGMTSPLWITLQNLRQRKKKRKGRGHSWQDWGSTWNVRDRTWVSQMQGKLPTCWSITLALDTISITVYNIRRWNSIEIQIVFPSFSLTRVIREKRHVSLTMSQVIGQKHHLKL